MPRWCKAVGRGLEPLWGDIGKGGLTSPPLQELRGYNICPEELENISKCLVWRMVKRRHMAETRKQNHRNLIIGRDVKNPQTWPWAPLFHDSISASQQGIVHTTSEQLEWQGARAPQGGPLNLCVAVFSPLQPEICLPLPSSQWASCLPWEPYRKVESPFHLPHVNDQ